MFRGGKGKRAGRRPLALCLAGGILMMQLAGCGQSIAPSSGDGEAGKPSLPEASQTGGKMVEDSAGADGETAVAAALGEGGEKTVSFEPEDFLTEPKGNIDARIVLTEDGITAEGDGVAVSGRVIVIGKGGSYEVSGQMADVQLRIEAGEEEVVHLILSGVGLSNENTAPIYGAEKCKVVLTLAEGTKNIVQDGTTYQYGQEGGDEPDAPIFVKGDLTVNGTGELEVYGNYQCGIRSKDSLKVMSGTISVVSVDDGLKGRDCVVIRDGILAIQAGKDGIKSNHDKDSEKGFIWIHGGEIRIAAKDDGIQAETALIVCGGNIDVAESQEGLAGKTVDILGGVVKVVAEDDGINSAASVETEREKMQDQEGVYTRIAGGEVWLDAMADGIDSNGDLYIEGGALYLSGPVSHMDGILDYNGKAVITGGTVFAAGSSGMMQTFGEESDCPYLVVYWEESQKAGSRIRLLDEEGMMLGEYTPEKEFEAAIICVPELERGKTYRVMTGEAEESGIEIAVKDVENVYGAANGPGRGGRGFGGGGGDRA